MIPSVARRFVLRAVVNRLPSAAFGWLRETQSGPSVLERPRRAARRLLQHGGVPGSVRTFRLSDNPRLTFVNVESHVGQQLFWLGEQGWEPELLPWWRFFCRRAATIVELGTNIGYFAVQAATVAPDANYIAVEPHPVSARVCRENLALNGVRSVRLVNAAATADPAQSTIQLAIPAEQLATPTVAFVPEGSELPVGMARHVRTTVDVAAVDVRSLLHEVDVLKLDVEGQEHALLEAGWDALRACRPTIFVEVLPGTPQLRALLSRLCTELGYRCYAPSSRKLVPVPVERIATVNVQREHRTNDLLLCARLQPPSA